MPNASAPSLSKSRVMAGRQCELRLWNEVYHRDLATPTSAATQAIFDQGHEVGILAQRRHPGGVVAMTDHREQDSAIARTRALMADPSMPAIFEAAFRHQGVFVSADLLVRSRDGWDLVEVKSTSHAKPEQAWDAAVQRWVLTGQGVDIRRAGVLTLNTAYVYEGGELDVQRLFRLHDFSDQAQQRADEIGAQVAGFQAMLAREDAPAILPGPQCHTPYPCPYFAHCTRNEPSHENPLTDLNGIHKKKVAALKRRGLERIEDLTDNESLSALQARIRECVRTGEPWISPSLGSELDRFIHPIHHLDFETVMPAIPQFPGTRPFQTVPIQWSCHREEADGSLTHHEFLSDGVDPQRRFAESLLAALGETGSICIYSHYENRILRELAEALPDLAPRLLALIQRTVDLQPIVKNHYYHPAFHGSFSIKDVLPVLVPRMSYEGLEVGDGIAAQIAFQRMLRSGDAQERADLRTNLLTYCALDTLAMVEVRKALLGFG